MTYPGEYYCLGGCDSQGILSYLASIDNVQPDLISR